MTEPTIVNLHLPMITPSRNVMDRTHFQARKRSKHDIGWLIKIAGGYDEKWKARFREMRSMRITSYRRRLIDHDNLVGGFKDLIDALEESGLIFTDGPKYLIHKLPAQIQVATEKEERTLVQIWILREVKEK